MKRVAWLTDIHLEFLEPREINVFIDSLAESKADIVLVGGDTGIASNFDIFLQRLAEKLRCPVYFVLGNHDFYHGSIREVRTRAEQISKSVALLNWLPFVGIVKITETTCLLGHVSWADGRLGNGSASQEVLNDYYLIEELTGLSHQQRFIELAKLGDQAADYFSDFLPQACLQFEEIISLTHVPPFRDSCWHEGKISDDEFLPHFACKATGEVFRRVMRKHPECRLTVLCGHTHSPGFSNILPNLSVRTGSAVYGQPRLQELIVAN